MRFRKRLFTVLAVLAALWACGGSYFASQFYAGAAQQTKDTTDQLAIGIANTTWLAIFLCTGIPLFFFFALLAWRNSVGLRNERKHQETLAAMRGG